MRPHGFDGTVFCEFRSEQQAGHFMIMPSITRKCVPVDQAMYVKVWDMHAPCAHVHERRRPQVGRGAYQMRVSLLFGCGTAALRTCSFESQ